ncbi:MAG: OmpA family protein [Nitriliruptoraceae bacterium]
MSSPRQRLSSLRRAVAMFGVVALVAVACGGGEGAEEPAATPPPTEAPPAPAPEPAPEPDPEPEPVVDGDAELVWAIDFEDKVNALAVHPDGQRLLAGTDATYIIHLADGYVADAIVYWYPNVADLDITNDGSLVGAGVNLGGVLLTTMDGDTPDELANLEGHADFAGARFHGGYDNRLAFSPDGSQLATGNRAGEVWLWDLSTATQITTLSVDDPDYLTNLAFHPSGDLLAATDFTCRVDLWDLTTGQVAHSLELNHSSCYTEHLVEFSPDGTMLAAAVTEDWQQFLRIWDVEGFTQRLDFDMDVRNFGDLSFSPDSTMLATASWRLPPTVWDVATGAVLYSLDSGIDPDVGVDGEGWYHPTAISFTPDGGHVAVGYYDGTLELWRLPGSEPLTAPEREVCEPLPLPGDVLFDTGSSVLRSQADEALTTLAEQLRDGFPVATLTFVGHTDSRGDAASNLQLSIDRAQSVRDWIEQWASDNGVDGWELQVAGRGDTELKVPDVGATGAFMPEAGAINRRVEIEIDAEGCLP